MSKNNGLEHQDWETLYLNCKVEKKTNEIYHDYLVKDFVGLEKIIEKYL